jgi:preprotein translocase subunit SecE
MVLFKMQSMENKPNKKLFQFFGALSAPLNKCQWATFEDQIISTYLTLCYFIKEFFNFQMIALKST